MLVLTGYTLEHVTCGVFKAAPHNVVSMANHAYMERLQTIKQCSKCISAARLCLFLSLMRQSTTMLSYLSHDLQ